MLKIDILFFEGCPNHAPTVRLVQQVVRDLAVVAVVREVEVKNHDDAMRLRFFGSPTIQVEGVDIEESMRGRTDHSFSCRFYGAPGPPPRDLIERALLTWPQSVGRAQPSTST